MLKVAFHVTETQVQNVINKLIQNYSNNNSKNDTKRYKAYEIPLRSLYKS